MKKWIPWIFVGVFAAWFLSGIQSPKSIDDFDVAGFGRLPVLLNGRVQPFDSVARNALLSMSGKSLVRLPDCTTSSASAWLLEVMVKPAAADGRKIFRVQHPDLQGLLGAEKAGLAYFSYNDLTNNLDQLQTQVRRLEAAEQDKGDDAEKLRTPFQRDLMHLVDSVILYNRLKNSLQPYGSSDFQQELAAYQASITASRAAMEKAGSGKSREGSELQKVESFYQRYQDMSTMAYPMIVPPAADQPRESWANMGTSLKDALRSGEVPAPAKYFAAMSSAYNLGQPADFNRSLAEFRVWLEENNLHPELKKGGQEFLFNQTEPFYKSMVIYVAALLLGCLFWLNLSGWLRQSGYALLILAFVIHTFGLGFRMYLEGRPPVTNLYSSAIFIGWGAVALGIILERMFKGGIGLVASGFIGFTTLIIAHHLALSGDTMEMLRAVLDTNLWLSTHVVVITIGYSSMFVAGLLAAIYIIRGFFTRGLSPDMAKALARMVYGIVCFATLTSFVGTILGGIWADQSWGRFWGWDPKENGALLIVIWNAIILHARWGGMIKERGLMAMAVFGNIVTSFSWFGVNMLGIGLHSYGFMDQAATWLMIFDGSQAALIVLVFLPPKFWASLKATTGIHVTSTAPVHLAGKRL